MLVFFFVLLWFVVLQHSAQSEGGGVSPFTQRMFLIKKITEGKKKRANKLMCRVGWLREEKGGEL